MSSESLRRLEELQVLYELEPSLRDIVVEGRSDAELVRWYLNQKGLRSVKVFPIDDRAVVERDVVLRAGGEVGPRGRVLGLAVAASDWRLSDPSLTCVIDADWDCLDDVHEIEGLLRTDYGSLDGYLFQERPLQKLLDLVIQRDVHAEEQIAALMPALN